MKKANVRSLFGVILMLAALGQIGSDVYLPSLPAIAKGFKVHPDRAQMTLAIYMFGFALSQLFYGPLSDGIGRRKPLLIGLVVGVGGTALCAFAPTINLLIVGRLIQGLGAGCGLSLSRSIMRDLFHGKKLARLSSYLGISMIGVVAAAPVIGGYLQTWFGWRSNFIFLLVYSGAMLALILWMLPETNAHLHPERLKPTYMGKALKVLFTSRLFMGCTLSIFFTYGAILAWLTAAPILLQDVMGMTPVAFGWLGLIVGPAFAVGGVANALLVHRLGVRSMLYSGIFLMLVASVLMLVFYLFGWITPTAVVGPITLFILGTGGIFPNAFAAALSPYPKMAGMSSAIFGFIQLGGGALSSWMLSLLSTDNQFSLSIVLIVETVLAGLMILMAGRKIADIENLQEESF